MRLGLSILVSICIGQSVVQYSSAKIDDDIVAYFRSAQLNPFRSTWNQFRRAFDDAISRTLKENYHENTMNIYAANQKKDKIVSHGIYAADQSVQLLCRSMVLRSVPRLYMTSVNVAIPSNVLRIEALVEKMFIDTQYHLYRNQTSEIYQGEQDLNRDSPFAFQQVQLKGDLTVLVQDCVLIGTVVTSLVGDSISLGADTIRLAECKFGVEISARAQGQPPVIAPYFTNEKGIELMALLSRPIREFIMTQLQGTALSYINTTDVFGSKLTKYQRMQHKILALTRDYTIELVSNLNKITIEKNQGIMKLDDIKLTMFKVVFGEVEKTVIELKDMVVTGLETAYSTHTGGPIQLKTLLLSEAITFSSLQVRGNLYQENQTMSGTSEFAAEILDYTVSVQVDIPKRKNIKFAPLGWRSLEFSIIHMDGSNEEREEAYSFITGYLSENLPKKFVAYFNEVYNEASAKTESEGAYKVGSHNPQENDEQENVPNADYSAQATEKKSSENVKDDNGVKEDDKRDDGGDWTDIGWQSNREDKGVKEDDKRDDGGDWTDIGWQSNREGRNDQPTNDDAQLDGAETDVYGADAKRLKLRRNVISQSDNEEERILRKRSDKKKN